MDTIAIKSDTTATDSVKKSPNDSPKWKIGGILFLFILLGTLTGFIIASVLPMGKVSFKKATGTKNPKQTAGVKNKKNFKDSASGILQEGGIEGEGSFHLERPGGEAQNVYLTSSVVDLSEYIGKKVKVWGETFSAEKAGWLMDVGLVELN